MGGVGKLVEDKSIVQADVAVVLGQDFKGVTPPPNASAPDTAATCALDTRGAGAEHGGGSEGEGNGADARPDTMLTRMRRP